MARIGPSALGTAQDRSAAGPAGESGRAGQRWRLAGAIGASLLTALVVLVIFADQAFGLQRADLQTASALLALCAALIVLPWRRALLGVLALVVVWIAGYAAYAWIPDHLELAIPVSQAVGGAAYLMSPYLDQQVAGAVLVVTTLVACVAFALLTRRMTPVASTAVQAGDGPVTRRTVLVATGLVALVCLALLPDLHKTLIDSTQGRLDTGWDKANLITWDAFAQRGLVPMKDYWYPYGATWLLTDFPTGPFARWVWQSALVASTGWALWRLAGPKPAKIAVCLLALVAIGGIDHVDTLEQPFMWRYMPALVMAVCYAAVGPLRHSRPTRGHVVFAAVCALVAAMEADIFLAGLAGAAFVALGELIFDPALRAWRTLRAALVDLLPIVAGLVAMLAFWAATDSFSGNLHWFTAFSAVTAASAAAQSQFGALIGLQADLSEVTMLVTIPALTLVVAFFQRRFGGVEGTASSRLLLAAAGVSTILLAKHLVRPQGPLMIQLPLLALTWTVIVQWKAAAIRTAIAAGITIGAVLGTLQTLAYTHPDRAAVRAIATPVRAVQDLSLVLNRGKVHVAGLHRFAPERFVGIPEKDFIADPLATRLAGTGDHRFATLGDAQILYALFGQRPPWHITLYDAAPISQQREWIDRVRELAPRLLVWRRDVAVDGVPYDVRAPLVFAYAIANYVSQTPGEPFDVLRRRRPGERQPERFWRKRLGPVVDLGGIPSYSGADDMARCTAGPGCVPYAIVKRSGGAAMPKVTVAVDDTPYAVQLTPRKGVESYAIRLDRLWFWPFAGGAQRLSVSTPGWTVERAGVKAGDALY